MKGDFTRDTFIPEKHYQQVRMQQGRVQLDADWNEQAALSARRDETSTQDLLGDCGGPADGAAFGVITGAAALGAAGVNAPQQAGNFVLGAGRYYVGGIQCELERRIPYTQQPDRPGLAPLAVAKEYLLYLDVWRRHVTALDDESIRESALGGADTATRVKTVWQVRARDISLDAVSVDPSNPCGVDQAFLTNLGAAPAARLTADTTAPQTDTDPCTVPAAAGYTGLENQLYRVEIHEPGSALDANSVTGNAVTFGSVRNQITVTGGTWQRGDAVEVFAAVAGSSKMNGQLAWVVAVAGNVLTLSTPLDPIASADTPRARKITGATWKWSRENGSVVAAIDIVAGARLTVRSLGPDKNLGFAAGDLAEIIDDRLELEGQPGLFARIADVDDDSSTVTLVADVLTGSSRFPGGLLPEFHPKLRRWEGAVAAKVLSGAAGNWLPLESGVRVRFSTTASPGSAPFRTGQYWQIPARASTAQATNGDIEWPREGVLTTSARRALPPRGIQHHYCRLATVAVAADGTVTATDCRCLFPRLPSIPRLFYVSGDGQEVMPDLTQPSVLSRLARPLIVGVANAHCLENPLTVQFSVTGGAGRVAHAGQAAAAGPIQATTNAHGMALCDFHLDAATFSQRVTARLLDGGTPVSLPIVFNANLSVASHVAYQPGGCPGLAGQKTVQDAIDRLADMSSLHKVSGDGQFGAPGVALSQPLVVLAANRCGTAAKMIVNFNVVSGGGAVDTSSTATDVNGIAQCVWTLGSNGVTQELEAELVPEASRPVTAPEKVRFVAHLVEAANDPAPVHVVGIELLKPHHALPNDATVPLAAIAAGVLVHCDREIDPDTVRDPQGTTSGRLSRGQPTCFVSVEEPFPLTRADISDWDSKGLLFGYRPVVLHGEISVEKSSVGENAILWQPARGAMQYLERIFQLMSELKNYPDRLLLRLTLKGNFIWSRDAQKLFASGTPGGFLDGDAFRAARKMHPHELLLPSGDGRRGGDFEMWFWIGAPK